jgi:hypothetical protein
LNDTIEAEPAMSAILSRVLGILLLAGALAACSGVDVQPGEDYEYTRQQESMRSGGLITGDTIYLFGGPDKKDAAAGSGIGVNSFLWRASLDTIFFMPLVSADPFGGVIITDWFSPPESPGERVKITVYILGRDLRADGVRAAVFRQRRDAGGAWIDATVEKRTLIELEDAILTRARQLRVAGLQ